MPKLYFFFWSFFIVSSQLLWAASGKNKIEIVAKNVDASETIFRAKDDVVIYYDDAIIKASSASFNKNEKRLVVDGNIEMIGYQGNKVHTDHIEIDTEKKEVTFQKLFLMSKNDIWLLSDKGKKKDGRYQLGSSMISSCDISNPLWKMVFDRSVYDSEAEFMQIYNAKMYVWDIPVAYSPYLSFSTNKERTSGFLFPAFGSTTNEGFFFEQPVFWAISKSMDLEMNPQIRSARSAGLYGTLRWVDSAHSSGKLRLGYFKDKQEYVQTYDLFNDSHYGAELNYESSQLFTSGVSDEVTDGLYLNSTYLNDIDYLNLQLESLEHFGLTPLQESRLNYFIQNSEYYLGVNAKYFIDTRANVEKEKTLQVLPSIQLHKYLTHFLWDNLTYKADLHMNNLYREVGVTMNQMEFKLPLEFTTSFWDDFVNLSLGEELYYSKYFFGNGEYTYDTFEYYSTIHKVKLFTDLTKKYDSFIHVLQPSLEYVYPGTESKSPEEFFSSLNTYLDEQSKLFAIGLPEEEYKLSINHYFYDAAMNLKFYQRLSQNYYPQREYKFADISNEMQYNWDEWHLYNNIIYAHEYGKIREASSSLTLDKEAYSITAGHTYKDILPDTMMWVDDNVSANDVYFAFNYNVTQQISINSSFTYDLDSKTNNQWAIGGSYHKPCWNFAASLREEIIPRPTFSGAYTKENKFYIQINFIPFGGIGSVEAEDDQR